ncbi:YqgE/AlgH family protein, partial [Desulfosarcina sp.]|uniref:YqgE/AlgH family protein n=1 Tax=Desulfosarcina sp. TaxID=2027861 RepID=UPI0029B3470E
FLSMGRDSLNQLVNQSDQQFRIYSGYSGWGPGQLESEIRSNTWITCPYAQAIVFQMEVERRWEAAMQGIGIDPALLSDTAGHA